MTDAATWVPAVIGAATLGFLVIDRIRGGGKKDASTADAIRALSLDLGRVEKSFEKTAGAVSANTELAVKLNARADEHERRLGLVEGVKDAFTAHAATDKAEHAAMNGNIDRLTRASEAMAAQVSRITPADTFSELIPGRRRKTGTDDA